MSIDSPITTYLPPDWKPSASVKTLTFRHLLTHSSGLKQVIGPMTKEKRAELGLSGSYNGLREVVKLKVVPTPGVAYLNTNYALLRVLNARMWKAAGGKLYSGQNVLAVKAGTDGRYAMDFLNRRVLKPSGIATAGCVGNAKTASLNYYRYNTSSQDKGALAYWPSDQCAGNAGLRLSSIEVVRYLAHMRHGNIVHPADLAQMDALHLGWDTGSTKTTFRHGGDITISGVQVHTCGITFPDGTEAALIINSPRGPAIPYQCDLLDNAWKNAMP
jgi:CubicO group peptidase (beta-lactamase class C family)